MQLNLIYVIHISVIFGGIPQFGPIGNYHCHISDWHYATSYYASGNINNAKEKCKDYDCDLIIEWTKKHGSSSYTGWDIGKFDARELCPQNPDFKAKIIFEKSYENYMNANSTVPGKFEIDCLMNNLS